MPELEEVIAACRAGHRRLFETLEGLDDDIVAAPSRLPDWTRGHVLTHLARNADSHVRILDGATRGESVEQYAGGFEERAAAIEAGSNRTAAELASDVHHAALRLEDAWARMTPDAWDGHGLARGRVWPCRDLPFYRWREVEVHHVDLDLGYQWPDDYVAFELPLALAALPARLPHNDDRRRLLAWLLGRADEPTGLTVGPWER